MVTGTHPDEIELFDYVEGDVSTDRRAEIKTHLATCTSCADQVARVQAGKDVLRDSQFLHLPPRRRDAIFMNLPEQRRSSRRSPALSPKRLLAILTPVVAVAAVIVALVSTGDMGSSSRDQAASGGGATAQVESSAEDSGAPTAGFRALKSVAGPASEVAAALRNKGIDARVVDGHVEVRGATKDEIDQALGRRKAGDVEIIIVS
jgi:anti-sigma factor RsiW